MKRWESAAPVPEQVRALFPDLHPVAVQLLYNRGIETLAAADEFLNPDYTTDIHDPFLFRDMRVAVDRVMRAIAAGEQIVVHGDYDSDGVCSSTLLAGVLRDLGGSVDVYLPHREKEGYGLNPNTVQALANRGVKLIITVDCGISNAAEARLASELGVDVIITDHHAEPPELPPALAVINPMCARETYPYRRLAGVGVAFKFAQAIVRTAGERLPASYEKWLLDLVALATVTDMMPLLGENRTLVKYGLLVMQKTRRPGLRMLMQRAGIVLTGRDAVNTTHIGFALGPRINASGRINHANTSFELLNAADEAAAAGFAEELEKNNTERQGITKKIITEIIDGIDVRAAGPVLFCKGTTWPMGIVGLVASKVKEQFSRPTFVFTENNGKIVGSGRSVTDFNMIEALQSMPELFTHFGGHKAACGMTFVSEEAYAEFTRRMTELAAAALAGKELVPVVKIDAAARLADVSWPLYEILEKFQPFGIANPQPVFRFERCTVDQVKLVGADQSHARIVIRDETVLKGKAGIAFRQGAAAAALSPGAQIDVLAQIDVNEWNGNRELQLVIQDFRKTENR